MIIPHKKVKIMLDNYIDLINEKIDSVLSTNECEYSELIDAMHYSASAGGKRIRPSLMMEFGRICNADLDGVLPFAVALEMIHTYSLIHDDLPCMDDDDMRRGKPSCHIKFGEATALLAGDALLTDAFKIAMSSSIQDKSKVVRAASVLAECAGSDGMIGGQVIDLKYENKPATLDVVKQVYSLKTSKLLVAAAKIGCILGDATEEMIKNAEIFAENLGIAFQIKDDILDLVGNAEILGKPIGSDSDSNKSTYVSLVGLDKAQEDVVSFTDTAVFALEIFKNEAECLKDFALKLVDRKF